MALLIFFLSFDFAFSSMSISKTYFHEHITKSNDSALELIRRVRAKGKTAF